MNIFTYLSELFSFKTPKPICNENTFFVWEPCTYSHAEVVPGFAKYLLDLGYEVSILITPERYKEGLFSKFGDFAGKIHFNKMSQRQIRKFIKNNGLANAKGLLLTTSGKLAESADYPSERKFFGQLKDGQKLIIVEHDVKKAFDLGTLTNDIVMLRTPYYKTAKATEVNPHYFGDVAITQKNADVVNFITVGALRGKRRNSDMLVEAVASLVDKGIENFKITCIGKGSIKHIPPHLQKFFDAKGQANFSELYAEMENADFFLPLLDAENLAHERYITTGTSGSFQLVFGFATPCVIEEKFAEINYLTSANSILYNGSQSLANAMVQAIKMSLGDYTKMQENLKSTAETLAMRSRENLKTLIN